MLIMDSEMFDYSACEPPLIPLVRREAAVRSAAGSPSSSPQSGGKQLLQP